MQVFLIKHLQTYIYLRIIYQIKIKEIDKMEGVRVTTMLPPEMVFQLEEIAKKEFSNKNVLLRQAVALFLTAKLSNSKFRLNKSKSQGK